MNTANTLQPLVSAPARIAGAIAAVAIIALSSFAAGKASHTAVDMAQASLHPSVVYMKLQPVEVVGRRLAGDAMAESGCAAPQTNI
jgi:hypothetical protein